MFLEVFLFAFLPPIRRVRNEKRTGTRRSAIGLISYPDLRRVKQSEICVRDYYWPSSSRVLSNSPRSYCHKKKKNKSKKQQQQQQQQKHSSHSSELRHGSSAIFP